MTWCSDGEMTIHDHQLKVEAVAQSTYEVPANVFKLEEILKIRFNEKLSRNNCNC